MARPIQASWVEFRKTMKYVSGVIFAAMSLHRTTRRRFVQAAGIAGVTLGGSGLASARGHSRNFRAHLAGENEVPPVETNARGQTTFQLSRDGDELSYRLIVANIEDVVAAHIHCAPAGVNGPVGVTLFAGGPTSEPGVLAEGTITEPDEGNGCGWESLDDVLDAIRSGDAYVNVHTVANPPGEIRGQIH